MRISIAPGDGIGPEITDLLLDVFRAAEVPVDFDTVVIGREAVEAGHPSGISPETREAIEKNGVLLKGPSRDAHDEPFDKTARELWGAFANKSVYRSLTGVPTPLDQKRVNLTMVRENVPGALDPVEQMLNKDVARSQRLTSRSDAERIHGYTFEMARRKNARRVTCAHNAAEYKLADGMFLDSFYKVAREFPELQADDVPVHRLAKQMVVEPETLDVIVLPSTQGDILTDLASGITGEITYVDAGYSMMAMPDMET